MNSRNRIHTRQGRPGGSVTAMVKLIDRAQRAEMKGEEFIKDRVFTDEQKEKLAFYESMARTYCQLLGYDPEETVMAEESNVPNLLGEKPISRVKRWHMVVDECSTASSILEAWFCTRQDRVGVSQPPAPDAHSSDDSPMPQSAGPDPQFA